jgi:hypothetical protein
MKSNPAKKSSSALFKSDSDWWNNAQLKFLGVDWNGYALGYKRAGDLLCDYVNSKARDQDILVYPIVFLYRHYLELRIKELIQNGSMLVERHSKIKTTHDIRVLWTICRGILEQVFPDTTDEDFKILETVIEEIAITDPHSDGFRYPLTKNGGESLPGISHINLRNFSDVFNRAASLLEGASTGISEYLAMKSDFPVNR